MRSAVCCYSYLPIAQQYFVGLSSSLDRPLQFVILWVYPRPTTMIETVHFVELIENFNPAKENIGLLNIIHAKYMNLHIL